jgi:hypothetical protein
MISKAVVAFIFCGLGTAARCQTVAPLQAIPVDLGLARGITYYVVEPDGFRVVTTVDTGSHQPVRFIVKLTPGQSASVSVPGALGLPETQIIFTHGADHLEARQARPADEPRADADLVASVPAALK